MTKQARVKELGRPIDTDSEQTRKNILTSAKYCFSKRGYRKTSNKDIAERANVTAATIYYYFKNKSDLFIAAHHESQKVILDIAHAVLKDATSMVDAWVEITQKTNDRTGDDTTMFNAIVRAEAKRNPELSEALYDHEWRDIFRRLVKVGISANEVKPERERELRAVLSALNFAFSHHAIQSSKKEHDTCVDGMINLFRGKLVQHASNKRC